MLTDTEHERLLALSWSLAAAGRDEDLLSAEAAREVAAFVGADEVDYNEIDLATSRVSVAAFPRPDRAAEIAAHLTDVVAEHPVVRHLQRCSALRPVRITDLLPHTEFVRTRTFEELFEPRDLRFQVVVPVQRNGPSVAGVGYALNRSRADFDDAALRRATAVQPVLAALHAVARARRPSAVQREAVRAASRLTPTEAEILGLVATGMTAHAIGRARRISVRTVRKHLENAYCKIGVHDRLQAVTHCRRIGLLAE